MFESIRRNIQKSRLILPGSKLVVAVSGGADSLAMLHVLYALQSSLGCGLHVATLDHGLRGEAGVADAQFVVQLAASWGLPVTAGQVDVKALASRQKMSVEAAARLARYDFLADVAHQVGAGQVAVAHHLGDQAETVLMHLIRGSGRGGLAGMAMMSPMPGHVELDLIRPMLWVTRAEIESYCREQSLSPREDATNADTTFLRNYIRWETLPHLAAINPSIETVLGQLADITQVEDDYLDEQLRQWLSSEHVSIGKERVAFSRTAFHELHPALARRLVNWAARKISPDVDSLGYSHIVEAVDVALQGGQGAIALLTNGVRLRVDYGLLVVENQDSPLPIGDQPLVPEQEVIVLNIPGETRLPGGNWTLVSSFEAEPFTLEPAEEFAVARLAIPVGNSISLRGRRDGDRFRPLGLDGHTQKVNRWMINRKVPRHLRGAIPLLCVDDDIAAIYVNSEWFIGGKYRVVPTSDRIIYFIFKKSL